MADYRLGAQLSIGIELTKIIPFKQVAQSIYDQAIRLREVKEFRDQGTDILIETGLRVLFGKGRIEGKFRNDWNSQIVPYLKQKPKFKQLFDLDGSSSEIELEIKLSAMYRHAMQDKSEGYLGAMMTLSLLSYFNNREKLGIIISKAIQTRRKNGLNDSDSLDATSISDSLKACSVDTSPFNWSKYSQQVKGNLQVITGYKHHDSHITFSVPLLLGAMDFLHQAQEFPEDRKILVSNPTGCVPLIIWAHYILGLNVHVLHLSSGARVQFGSEHWQVLIEWPKDADTPSEGFYWSSGKLPQEPEIQLLDKNLNVQVKVVPKGGEREEIRGEERSPLRGYGTAYLTATLNKVILTDSRSDIWQQVLHLVCGFALHLSQRLYRNRNARYGSVNANTQGFLETEPLPRRIELSKSTVLSAASLLFDGHDVSTKQLNDTEKQLRNNGLDDCLRRNFTVTKFVRECCEVDDFGESDLAAQLRTQIEHLAKLVIVFTHVAGIDNYVGDKLRNMEPSEDVGKMQIVLCDNTDFMFFLGVEEAAENPNACVLVEPNESFHAIIELLSPTILDIREDTAKWRRGKMGYWLCSDSGWSVYLDTAGVKDPSQVRPELIHIQRGTPVDREGLRKFRIRDGTGHPAVPYPDQQVCLPQASDYEPRSAACASVEQFWRVGPNEFENTLFFKVIVAEEWEIHTNVREFEEVASFREMQENLWQTFSTPECPCNSQKRATTTKAIFGSDTEIIVGWAESPSTASSRRFLIYLTKGEKNVRWLAVNQAVQSRMITGGDGALHREVMLRTSASCEDCAMMHLADQPGNWILIL